MKIYYKDVKDELHCVQADDFQDVDTAIKTLRGMMDFDGEQYKEPILALIQGGKE